MVEPPELTHSTLATLYLLLLLPDRLPRRAYHIGMKPPTLMEEPGSAYEPLRWDAVSEPGPPVATNRLYAPILPSKSAEWHISARFCMLIQGVDNPDQAPLRPAPIPPRRPEYSRIRVSMQVVATFDTAGFREELFSATR